MIRRLMITLNAVSVAVLMISVRTSNSDSVLPLDLKCKSHFGFQFCEGRNDAYSAVATTLPLPSGGSDLLTRSAPGGGPYAGGYGFMPALECHRFDQDRCEQMNAIITPTFLLNHENEPRYILQWGSFQQRIRLSICSENSCSYGRGTCDQQYATVQMLSWDPGTRYPQLQIDRFRIPSCCRCRRSSFLPPHSNYYNGGSY